MAQSRGLKIRNSVARLTPWWIRRLVPEFVFKHFYPYGVFTARLNGKPQVRLYSSGAQVENEIFWRGLEDCHEKLSMKIWIMLCQQFGPKTVWDVGANTGTYGVIAKHYSPSSEVHLFEPLHLPMNIAKRNFALNSYQGNFYELALGNFDGEASVFLESEEDFAYSVTVNKNLAPKSAKRELQIEVQKAKNFVKEPKQIPSLIKLDVETFEPEVLEGFGRLDLSETIFLIEILNDQIAAAVEEFLPPSAYIYFNIDDKQDSARIQEHLSKSDFYNFLILPRDIERIKLNQVLEFVAKFEV